MHTPEHEDAKQALRAKRGEVAMSSLTDEQARLAETMSEEELEDRLNQMGDVSEEDEVDDEK